MEDSVLNCDRRPQATYQNVSLSITQMTRIPLYTEMEINIMVGNLLLFVKLGQCQLHCIASDLIFIFISELENTYSD